MKHENSDRAAHLKDYRFKPGQSGNPNGRPKSAVRRAMLVKHRRDAVATLLQLMRSADKDATRLDAVKLLLAYTDGPPNGVHAEDLTDSELLDLALRRSAEKEGSTAKQ